MEKYSGKLAAVVLEPVPANMGVISPDPEFLKDVIELTHKAGGLVIFDEVITGLRFSEYRARSYMTVIDLLHNLTYIKNYKNSVI